MFDTDTFLIGLYTTIDDSCIEAITTGTLAPEEPRPGPSDSLSRSEVVALSIFGQLSRFSSERDFYRFADRSLRHLFPKLPDRSQFSRLQMKHQGAVTRFALDLASRLSAPDALGVPAYEVLDRCGVATRWCGRRGVGWMPEEVDKGLCSRLRWFEGFHLLTCVTEAGVISGWGIGPASAKDQPMAEAFLYARYSGDSRLPTAGVSLSDSDYVMDKGFDGAQLHERWQQSYGVRWVVCPPQKRRRRPEDRSSARDRSHRRWSASWHRLCASWRQIVESAHDKLLNFCRLARERTHDLSGFSARLSAKIALHNFCMFLNWQSGRDPLAFADLIA